MNGLFLVAWAVVTGCPPAASACSARAPLTLTVAPTASVVLMAPVATPVTPRAPAPGFGRLRMRSTVRIRQRMRLGRPMRGPSGGGC